MKLLGHSTWLLSTALVCALVEASPIQQVGTLARRTGLPRDITIVSDLNTTESGGRVYGQDIHPAHSWALFSGTEADEPIRLEVVNPIFQGQPEGLALAVTKLPRTWRGDLGQADYPVPAGIERRMHVVRGQTAITNQDIFDPDYLGQWQRGSLVEGIWSRNARSAADRDINGDPVIQTSHGFVATLLSIPRVGIEKLNQADENALAYVLWNGRAFARETKIRLGFTRSNHPPPRLDHLFYEEPATDTNGADGSNPRRQTYRRQFVVTGPYFDKPQKVFQGLVADVRTARDTNTSRLLSRNGRLTSDLPEVPAPMSKLDALACWGREKLMSAACMARPLPDPSR